MYVIENQPNMKRLIVILSLLIVPFAVMAQAIGQVPFGARVFSTGLPATIPMKYFENGGPKMSKERRGIAIRCIERTFGKVKEFDEYWGECADVHIFVVKLESGDDICFENGCLGPYTIVSPRFTVGRDCLQGGLRVGQKLDLKKSRGEWVIYQSDSNPNVYYFSPAGDDNVAYVIVDEKGIIQSIHKFTNDC